jgi:hypothetical protein
MPEFQVKKVVAVCFLESAKLALEHLGAHRLQLSQDGHPGPDQLPRMYGDVRRLRDYLQRSVSGYQDVVKLDLSDDDAGLLVACCRRSVEFIEHRLAGVVPADERNWLAKKSQVLADWAHEIAAKPLIELPLARLNPVTGEATRALTSRIQHKIFGEVSGRQQFRSPQHSMTSRSQGIASFGDALVGAQPVGDPYGDLGRQPVADAPVTDSADPVPPEPAGLPPLLDRNRIQDPRLRAQIGIDMRSLERCYKEGDHRLSTVMLGSVMESALLDHAIPRRAELGLTGTPDTWNVQELLLRAMGDAAQPKDRSLAFHLFASRNLLRPALQMVTPAVVTAASFERLHEFVGRALHELGFAAPAKMLPPGSVSARDLPQ